jgi:hypothetical protein
MYWLTGTCDRLVTPDGNHTAECNKALGLIGYSNGRRSYWFSIPHKSLIAFSGTNYDGKGGRLELDIVTLASSPDPHPSEARGSCTFDDPWKGPAHIRCQGKTEAGDFAAEFTTDGKPPQGNSSD